MINDIRYMKNNVLILLVIFLGACAAKTPSTAGSSKPDTTQADVERAQVYYPGMTVASFSEAKSLYELSCGNCHGLKKPSGQSEEKWRSIMPRMVVKANKKGASLTPENEKQLLAYVLTMRTAAN